MQTFPVHPVGVVNGGGEGPLGLVSASVVELGGRVVFTFAPVHLDGAGVVGRISDALFLTAELPSLGFHDMVNGGLFSVAHG